MNDDSIASTRSCVDIFHFALCAVGFFTGVTGIVVGSPCIALLGACLVGWGLLYFAVNS